MPYGVALPRTGSAKSCTFTRSGAPAGIHSTPLFAKFPTNSFFFASHEMTGSPDPWNAATCVLMYRNWASRSGCWRPSTVLALPCRLYPAFFNSRPTVSALTSLPAVVSSSARCDVDFVVHRKADSGSPLVSGSTSLSNAGAKPASTTSAAGRPAPTARTRPSGTTPDSNSRAPRATVSAFALAATATSFFPPCPITRASAPNSSRQARSSRNGLISPSLAAIRSCSATVIDIPQRYRLVPDKPRQFSGEPLVSVLAGVGEVEGACGVEGLGCLLYTSPSP